MGVYIKGMGMPDRDHLVLVEIDSNGDVFAAYDGGRTKLTQYKASLVHEPHGRLIDADALGSFPYNMDFCDGGEADEWIQNAPTIIEAEG